MTTPRSIAVHALGRGALPLAARVAAALDGAELFVSERLAAEAPPGAISFALPMRDALARSFHGHRAHVFVMAIGAVVRMIAPLLRGKGIDPAVVCMDEAGRFAVPVLSGHVGGANALAARIAAAVGAQPVLTTASDVQGTLAVDLLGAELGWRFEDPRGNATRAAAAVVNGEPVAIVLADGSPAAWPEGWPLPANATLCSSLDEPAVAGAEAALIVTDRLLPCALPALARAVLYRPRSLVLGVGCDRGAPEGLVARGVEAILAGHGLAAGAVREVASVDLKADEPALRALAVRLGCPFRTFGAAELDATPGIENPSERVSRLVGTRGVAEPAALRAAGAGRLLVPKQVYTEPGAGRSMTVAVARTPGARSSDA
ncbi:MAG TPA: cobalamin biosynthesis protein [Anaeromyxobacteraceae bacterium]|nr:cobalamin biosynthesis protein [Anaeromyxobacteraceae bacterium]